MIIIFIATLVRSTFGFGESLVAVPLLILFIPAEVAVPLSVLVSTLVAAVVVVQDRTNIHVKSAKWLVAFAALGIPLGLLVLVYGNENFIKFSLGALLILYSIYSLIAKEGFRLKKDSRGWLFLCGFFSGVLGGAYGLNGPPLVVYGNLRSWSAKHFRATLQAYFLVASSLGMLGYWYKGLWTPAVTHHFLISLPVILPAIFLGRFLNHRINDGSFLKYIYVGLSCIGVLLIVQALV